MEELFRGVGVAGLVLLLVGIVIMVTEVWLLAVEVKKFRKVETRSKKEIEKGRREIDGNNIYK